MRDGCSRKTLSKAGVSGVLSLKPFIRKPLKAGTRIVVTVTRPGAIGIVKTLTVQPAKRPTIATRCLAPGAASASRC